MLARSSAAAGTRLESEMQEFMLRQCIMGLIWRIIVDVDKSNVAFLQRPAM